MPLFLKKKKPPVLPQKSAADLTEEERMVSHTADGRFAPGNHYGVRPGMHPRRGRSLKKTVSSNYRDKLNEVCHFDPAGRTWGELIALSLCENAAAGSVPAAKELREATEGHKHVHSEWRRTIREQGGNPDEVLYRVIGALELPKSNDEVEEE